MMRVPARRDFNALNLKLNRQALDIAETVDALEEMHLSDEQGDLLTLPTTLLQGTLDRIEQIAYDVYALDQGPRLRRLRRAAA